MKFSVITACFNSSETLGKTYSSLLQSTTIDFEWILVDDCSTDDGKTQALMRNILLNAPFPVKLKFLNENYFGSRSTYEACLIAEGEFACILDHDDQITADAFSVVLAHIDKYENKKIAGIAGRCVDQQGRLIGKKFKKNVFICNEGDLIFKKKFSSELFQFTKIDILRATFLSLRPGYTNGFAWAKISVDFDFVFVNDILRVYDMTLATSYSNNKNMHVMYPREKAEALQSTLEYYNDYLVWNPFYALRLAGSSIRHRLNADRKLLIELPKKVSAKIFYVLGIPFGYVKYLITKLST